MSEPQHLKELRLERDRTYEHQLADPSDASFDAQNQAWSAWYKADCEYLGLPL